MTSVILFAAVAILGGLIVAKKRKDKKTSMALAKSVWRAERKR